MSIVVHDGAGPALIATPKDPNEVLDYHVSWGSWLRSGETISSRSWSGDGVFTIDSNSTVSSEVVDGTTYTAVEIVVLSGGTAGKRGLITCRVTTNLGRTADRSFYLYCRTQ